MRWIASFVFVILCAAQAAPVWSAQATEGTAAQATQSNATPQDQNAVKAKTLLDQMIQALGGVAYLNISDMSQEGRTYSFHLGQPTGAGAPFWRFWKYPDKERVELTKQRDWLIIHNGDKGYEVTFRGVSPEEQKTLDDYLRRREHSLEWVIRRWLKEPGIALFYEGQAIAAEKQAEQVTIMNAKNDAVTIYIDSNNHLPLKKTFTWRDPTDRQRNDEGEIYDNYKVVQGISTPLSVTRTFNGDMTNQRFISSVSYNQNLDDSFFDPQAARIQKRKK